MPKKILVSYFSASGVTKTVARTISNTLNSDLFEIEPVEKYTSEDLDWTNKQSRSTIEMENNEFRPPIKNKVTNIDDYDTIILGFPVWWYTAPTIINTFIEENDLTNKNIYIFVTSGSSTVESSFHNLQSKYSNLHFISGKRFTKQITNEEIINWIKGE